MPITPLHIGIPGLIGYYYPGRVDLFSLLIGSIIIDLDFFLFLLIGTEVHGYAHTFLGALIISILVIIIIHLFGDPIWRIKKWFNWDYKSNFFQITLGVFIGTYSHIILDGLIYNDIKPFYPLNDNILFIENLFPTIYFITAITTIIFLILYITKSWEINKR